MISLLRKRRSIRKYASKPVGAAMRRRLTEALLRSPSSRDIKPWHFIVIDDPNILSRLSRCKTHGAEFLAKAPLGIVICGDETKSDVWVEDCAIASVLVQLAALDQKLGSCWIQVRNRAAADGRSAERIVQTICGLPKSHRVLSIIAIGYPAESKKPVPARKLAQYKVHRNTYKQD